MMDGRKQRKLMSYFVGQQTLAVEGITPFEKNSAWTQSGKDMAQYKRRNWLYHVLDC